jgi:hypothetical protein
MRIGWLGWGECLVILVVLMLVAAFAFRAGYFRGRGR